MIRNKPLMLLSVFVLTGFPQSTKAGIDMGTAGNFSVLAGSAVTNTGTSFINGGDVGLSSASSITGFSQAMLAAPYSFQTDNSTTTQAQSDLAAAYADASALTPMQNLSGQDMGGLTLTPGVYFFSSSAQLTGTLTLNNLGDSNAQFVFQIGSTLTTATGASVVTINGGMMPVDNVFWQVGSSATLNTGTAFEGHILALTSITLATGASILDGSALAMNGAVTLDTNLITNDNAVPEPATLTLLIIGGTLMSLHSLAKKMQ